MGERVWSLDTYRIVEVTWRDSLNESGWSSTRATKDFIQRAESESLIRTVGYVVADDEISITLRAGGDDTTAINMIHIPRCAVVRVRELGSGVPPQPPPSGEPEP